jgi:hypothetical protein
VVRAADDFAFIAGIYARTPYNANNRPIDIVNRGSIDSAGPGILAVNLTAVAGDGSFNPISIANHAAIRSLGDGISTHTDAAFSGITIVNTGNVVTGEGTNYSVGFGVFALTHGPNSPIAIVNAGVIDSGNVAFSPTASVTAARSTSSIPALSSRWATASIPSLKAHRVRFRSSTPAMSMRAQGNF